MHILILKLSKCHWWLKRLELFVISDIGCAAEWFMSFKKISCKHFFLAE